MLANQERDLTGLDFSALQELRTALDDSRRLLDEAQGLSFDVEQARRTFGRLYPDSFGAAASAGQMARDAQDRWSQARDAVRTAVQLLAPLGGQVADDEQPLYALVGRSQSGAVALQPATVRKRAVSGQSVS